MERVPTEDMVLVIRDSATWQQAAQALDTQFHTPMLGQYVGTWVAERGLTLPAFFAAAGIEKSMGYKVLSGKRRPGRDTLIRMALALRMDLDAAQRLLALGGQGALYPRNRRDALIIHALTHSTALDEVQSGLSQMGEPSLWNGE